MLLSTFQLSVLLPSFTTWAFVSSFGQILLTCDSNSVNTSGYICKGSQNQCNTFAILRTNTYYSSLSNLTLYLGLTRFSLAEANGFSPETEYLPPNSPLLIPIDCKCTNGVFGAELSRSAAKGDSFYGIAESLEGLTTCKEIRERNPFLSPWEIKEKVELFIPLRCACPVSPQQPKILLTYPVSEGDTVSNLAVKFNITPQIIVSTNRRLKANFNPESLVPVSTLLIPLNSKPILASLEKSSEHNLGHPAINTNSPVVDKHKSRSKMWKLGVYIAISGVAFGATIAIAAALIVMQWRRRMTKKLNLRKTKDDVELQQLSLSVRTTSDKKVSFEDPFHHGHKTPVEIYSLDELKKTTEDFSSNNLIEAAVYHGRLNGKNLAIKRTKVEVVSKIEMGLFQDSIHHHPNIIRLLGSTSVNEVIRSSTSSSSSSNDSFLVFEYAKNGSLKDWLHGGLAMKSQFIASCYCFLNWNQRLRICLDVATALQYMHQIMNPNYVHRNIKSRNIFLDEEFSAKLGNFGMAKCVYDVVSDDDGKIQDQESCSNFHPDSWNRGYLAPEYVQQGVIASGIDIFAYGVVLLEVLSGKPPMGGRNEKGEGTVWLWEKIKLVLQSNSADELREWMDNALGENYSFDAAVTLANLARACVDDDPSLRPNAGDIVEKLSRLVEELPEGEQFTICESSCKPLVNAAANNM